MIIYLEACLLVLSSFAWAQDASISANYSDAYHECYNAGDTNNALIICVTTEESKWHIRLNEAYRALMVASASSPERKGKLREAQKQWLVFKDKWCDVSAAIDMPIDLQGGTGFKLVRAGCTLKLTAQRTIQLEAALEAQKHSSDGFKSGHSVGLQ